MKKKMYEKIMDQCENLLGDKYKDLAQIEVRIDEKATRRRELLRKLDHIKATGTFEEYEEARKEISKLDHELESLQDWKNNIEKNKLISSEEYEALIQEATDEVSQEVEALPSHFWNVANWACSMAESYNYTEITGKQIRKEG